MAVALLLVIAISVGATLLFTRDGGGGNPPTASPPTSGPTSEIASADDTGPVAIITEDPTCDAWTPIVTTLSRNEANGWDKRDPSIPRSSWSPEQRRQYREVGKAMTEAASQIEPLITATPHRVMRELYGQTIAYLRAYANSVASYTPIDDNLAVFTNTSAAAINSICSAKSSRAAAARAPLISAAAEPKHVATIENPTDPQRFLPSGNPACAGWISATDRFNSETADWQKLDPTSPSSDWTVEQRDINEAAAPIMLAFADQTELLGRESGNPIWADFADLSAQYRRALVASLPNYVPADNHLNNAAAHLVFVVKAACQASGS
ncbi:MAG: hypothetical protein JST91_16045 [Actinobacteria bacterium]|nr:hypothetical protein [Actinomycetota bacterium]